MVSQHHGGNPRKGKDHKGTSRFGGTRIRTRLLAMVIVPLLALGVFALSDLEKMRRDDGAATETANRLERFEALRGLVQGLRLEQSMSEGVVALRSSGTDLEVVTRSLGIDLIERLNSNRERVDVRLDAVSGRINAESGQRLAAVITMRERIDDRAATLDEVRDTYALATSALGSLLAADGQFLRTTLARLPRSDELNNGFDATNALFELLLNQSAELIAVGRNVIPAVRRPADRMQIAASSQQARALELELKGLLVGQDLARFEKILSTPAATTARQTEATILHLFGLVDGPQQPNDVAVIARFIESQSAVADDLTAFAQDEAQQLAQLARAIGQDTGERLLASALRTAGLTLATLLIVSIVVRSIERPLSRVEEQARLISTGSLDHPPLPASGPVEVVVVAEAINSLATNLQRLVAQSTAIANGQIDAAVLRQSLPGSLGASVQATMDRLSSMTTQLRQSAQHAQAIVQHVGEAIFTVTNDGILQTVNAAGARLLGYSAEALIGSQIRHYLRGGLRSGENAVYRADGDILVTLTVSQVAGTDTLTVIARDITRIKEREEQLTYQASHDALTGLTNRAAFMDALAGRLTSNQAITVFFLDLDGFKGVNDTYGHAAGDELLRAFAKRFNSALRTTDVGARFGGDEFVALVHGLDDNTSSIRFGQRLVELIEQPFQLTVGTVSISASVGLMRASRGLSPEEIVKRADAAAYDAKAAGKGRVRVSGNELLPGPAALLADEIRQLRR